MKNSRAWIIWALASSFYLYELVMRILPSVIVPELMETFSLTTLGVGSLSAFFYYAYTPLQLPVGVFIDRFGARSLLTLACFLSALGSLAFGLAPHFGYILAGRFAIGAGSAFAWVGLIYLISHWFPPKRIGLLIGLASSLGLVGGICGQGPMAEFVKLTSWRYANYTLAIIGFVLTFAIWFIIRNRPEQHEHPAKERPSLASALLGFKTVLANKQSWIVATYSTMIYLCISVFAELWGISFLQTAYSMDRTAAGYANSMIYLGFLAGGPLAGVLSDHLRRRKPVILIGAFFAAIFIGCVVLIPHLSFFALYALLFCFGLTVGTQLLSFSISIEINSIFAKGSALAFNNFVTMIGGSVMQPVVGLLLVKGSIGIDSETLTEYTAHDFRCALIALPIACFIGFILTFFIKETRCEQKEGGLHPFEAHAD